VLNSSFPMSRQRVELILGSLEMTAPGRSSGAGLLSAPARLERRGSLLPLLGGGDRVWLSISCSWRSGAQVRRRRCHRSARRVRELWR